MKDLSIREQQVLEAIIDGRSDKQIAGDLGIHVQTVRYYLAMAKAKLGVNGRVQAALEYDRKKR